MTGQHVAHYRTRLRVSRPWWGMVGPQFPSGPIGRRVQPNGDGVRFGVRTNQHRGMCILTLPRSTDLWGESRCGTCHAHLAGCHPRACRPVAFRRERHRFVACAKGRIRPAFGTVNEHRWKELRHCLRIRCDRRVGDQPDGRWLAVSGFQSPRSTPASRRWSRVPIYDLTTGKKKADSPDYRVGGMRRVLAGGQ